MKKNSVISIAMLIAITTLLSGCVVAPAPYRYSALVTYAAPVYPDVAPAPIVAYQPPPAPQVEVVGAPPYQGYFWISGVWVWEGGRHVWHAGHWQAPRAGYAWVPHQWHQVGNVWHLDGGHWQRH